MIVAGIDPSLSATAVCVGDGDAHEMRVFKSAPRGREVQERFARYEDLVSRIIDWLEPHCPAVICLEGYAHAAGGGSMHNMIEASALLRWHLVGLEPLTPKVYEVSPTSLKAFITGKGNCFDKTVVAGHIVKQWGVVLNSNDEYDGFALYRMALCCAGRVSTTGEHQQKAITKVLLGPNNAAAERAAKKEKKLARMFETAKNRQGKPVPKYEPENSPF